MKQVAILTTIFLLFSYACKEDTIDFDYDPGVMHYDGVNANAPFLPAGTTEAAARFPEKVLDYYRGKQIEAVDLYIYDLPESSTLIFYGSGGSRPGIMFLEQDISNALDSSSWNTIPLDTPFPVPAFGDLWISLRMQDPSSLQVIGCDAGPNKEGGDWLYQSDDREWRTFRDRSTDNINWNIRAIVF
jgi:hypothetical protein